jgi:hypothetical protein
LSADVTILVDNNLGGDEDPGVRAPGQVLAAYDPVRAVIVFE